jgi:hypothetical protein
VSAIFPPPAVGTVAARVLSMITDYPGLPYWAIARNTRTEKSRTFYALAHLRRRGFIHARTETYATPDHAGERAYQCWYLGGAVPVEPGTLTCTVAKGYGRDCGTRLVDTIDRTGRVTWHCPACLRRARGLCQLCPSRTLPKRANGPAPWYCPTCIEKRRRTRNNKRMMDARQRRRKAQLQRKYDRAKRERLKAAAA